MIGQSAYGIGLSLAIASASLAADDRSERKEATVWPGMTRAGAVLLPNGWSLKPAGKQTKLGDFPILIAENPQSPILAVSHAGYGEHEVITLDVSGANAKIVGRVSLHETFGGLVWSKDGKRLFAGGAADGVVYRFDHADGLLSNKTPLAYPRPKGCLAGLALSKDGRALWVADAFNHSVARLDAEGKSSSTLIELDKDSYPYALEWDEAKDRLYVSLWGKAEIAVIDSKNLRVVAGWKTREHPNEMKLARGGGLLYVAHANRNTVGVVDTKTGQTLELIGTARDSKDLPGCTPNSLALSSDENLLFAANANTNELAVFNVKEPGESKPLGFVPTGWYPTCVRIARDDKRLFIAEGKGITSKANPQGPNPLLPKTIHDYIGGLFQGTLSTLPLPGPKEMSAYTRTVYACSPLHDDSVKPPADCPIPAKVGDPSPIRYCVYIIKENRTYDQVFGDMPEGNGEPSLCLFPEKVTPNHHALAREFVLLDNFYVDGEVSADGHEWTMGAYASDYVERVWPLSYRGDKRVGYPSEGQFAIARPAGGYLWDKANEKGVSYRSYGEFIGNGKTADDPGFSRVKALQDHFDPYYRSFDMDYPDVRRAARFLKELGEFEKKGEMPRLTILRLPNDHTVGTAPGKPTPTACVADNDLALGRVMEGLSKSKFWSRMAVFVVEDDAQNGSDHVDAHRTVALLAGPFVKRRTVDSTMYDTSSMLRTIELCLGLEPMSRFDAGARPMWKAFTSKADASPYRCRPAEVDLNEKNLKTAWGAKESSRLDLEIEDRADDLTFNEIIWKSVKGANSPMPPPVRSAFVLPRIAATKDPESRKDRP